MEKVESSTTLSNTCVVTSVVLDKQALKHQIQISHFGELPSGTTMDSVSTLDKKLFISSLTGDIEGVITALVQGGRVTVRNIQGATPLIAAAQKGHTDICGLLLAHGSNVNEVMANDTKQSPLQVSASKGHNATVEALLSWGAEVNPQDHTGYTPLHLACQEGHLLCVQTLLKAGASLTLPDNRGSLPIHCAAQNNRMEVVRFLLERGCSPDMVRLELS